MRASLELGLGRDLGEGAPLARELGVERGERRLAGGVDEEAGGVGHELVAGGALHRPVRQLLAGLEDLLHPHPLDPAVGEAAQVLGRVGEAVGVVDPQPVDDPLGDQPEHQGVGGLEDLGVLLAHAGQLVDGEEAPVPARVGVDVEEPPPQPLVGPERVLVGGRHVVGDDVQQHVQARAGQLAEGRLAAEVRGDPARVDDVVAVGRAAPGLERGGEVEVAHAELAQVRHQPEGVGEPHARGRAAAGRWPSPGPAHAAGSTGPRGAPPPAPARCSRPRGPPGRRWRPPGASRLPNRRAGSRKPVGS